MNLKDRIVERAAALLVAKLHEDKSGMPDTKPLVDGDGDLHCPNHPDKVFVTRTEPEPPPLTSSATKESRRTESRFRIASITSDRRSCSRGS